MTAIYMQLDSSLEIGASNTYTKWIAINHLSFGLGRDLTAVKWGQDINEGLLPSFSEISISKSVDLMSPKIFAEMWDNKVKELVKIHLVRAIGNELTSYLEIELNNVFINSYSLVVENNNEAKESCSLIFGKISMQCMSSDINTTPIIRGFDLMNNKSI